LVEKRTFVFAILAIIVWASLSSAFAGLYYLQYNDAAAHLSEIQNSVNHLTSDYDAAVNRYNLVLGKYSSIYGNYSFLVGNNYTELVPPLKNLVLDFGENYSKLVQQTDLNRTYNGLIANLNILETQGNVTKDEYGKVLNEFYSLFSLAAFRDFGQSISEAATLEVNVCIDYGNNTVQWHNETRITAGDTLFNVTRELTNINYTYNALMEPGHVLVDSINGKAAYVDPSYSWGYSWIWYYWSDEHRAWVAGPVGCDAWLLNKDSLYKWAYERWSFP